MCCLIWHGVVFSEQLPFKSYTVADGLASNFVSHIYQDSRGFIWFSTGEGLSQFDGYTFRNFDERDGLPAAPIRSVTEDDKGRLWVTTSAGIARLEYEGEFEAEDRDVQPMRFKSFRIKDDSTIQNRVANQVNRILFHPDGSMWCLTDYGLYKVADPYAPEIKFEAVFERDSVASRGAVRDKNGSLWFGLTNELIEVRGMEITSHGSVGVPFPKDYISDLQIASDGRMMLSHAGGLLEFTPPQINGEKGTFKKLELKTENELYGFLLDGDNALWVATKDGLSRISGDSTITYFGTHDKTWTQVVLGNDNDKNLWSGIYGNGVRLLTSESVANFIPGGKNSKTVGGVFEAVDQGVLGVLDDGNTVSPFTGEFVSKPTFNGPFSSSLSAWFGKPSGRWQYAVENSAVHIEKPLLRLRNGKVIDVSKFVELQNPAKGSRFYEDEQRTLWIARADKKIYRGKSATNGEYEFESFPIETPFSNFGSRIIGDGADGVWLAHPLFLGRFRNGKYEQAKISEGLPERDPRSVFRDSRGWLWIGHRNKGVSVTRNPAAHDPEFKNYSRVNSPLPSNAVRSITEDAQGRMYFATDRGLARFDIEKEDWRYFSTKTGLAGDQVYGVLKDSKGLVWAGTNGGLSRIDASKEKPPGKFPQIYITSLSIGGKNIRLPIDGTAEIPKIEVGQSDNSLIIGYVAPHFDGRNLSYQYRLGNSEWSAPTKERTVNFSLLAAGSYRFEVRAVDGSGISNEVPAAFAFRILPPIWQRWWFILGSLGLFALALYWLYRMRVKRLIEIERTRTRIATDLHDDIGTNLSKISLLSEIVKMQTDESDPERRRLLDVIGETSRESVGAMSDIVWAINPQKDSLSDMTRRMRQYAEEVFVESDVKLEFNAPSDGRTLRLAMDLRRELYLIFKEAVNNAAKHSGCKNVKIDFEIRPDEYFIRVSDDGRGFDQAGESDGNGLKNLRLRAEKLGAKLAVDTKPGEGARVSVSLPKR